MSISEVANRAISLKRQEEERYVWFRAQNGDDLGKKDYKFLNDMEEAKGASGARVIAITVPYSPNPERERHFVAYATFKGDFNEKQQKIVSQQGRELDVSTYNADNALLSHLNGYNDEVDTNIDLTQKPSSYDAFEGINDRKYRVQPTRTIADFHFLNGSTTLQ